MPVNDIVSIIANATGTLNNMFYCIRNCKILSMFARQNFNQARKMMVVALLAIGMAVASQVLASKDK